MSDSPRSVLADVVRLWACAPTGATPAAGKELALPPGWVQALGRTPVFARSTLSLPRGEISLQVITPPPPEPPQPPKPQGRAPLQASPLVVVSADLQSAEQSQQRIEEQGRQPDLKPEDYGPLVQGREPRLPLAPKARWWPALRQFAPRKAGGLDLRRLVALLAQAKPLTQWPVLQRRGQFRELCVLRDKRKAMVPFDADFAELLAYLRAQPQAARLTVRLCDGLPSAIPATADAVLVLSDLGWSEPDAGQWPQQRWQDWAWRLTQKGVAVQAWVPVAAQMLPSSLVRRLDCVPWHAHSRFKPVRPGQAAAHPMHKWAQAAQAKAQLWPRLAVAQRVEPALLRRARLASGGAGQPQWESLLWRDDADLAAGFVALQTRPNAVAAWRAAFAALPCAAQLQVWHMLQAQHAHLPRSTLVVERLVWHSHACQEARHQVAEDVNQAQAWLQRMAAQEARNTQAQAHGLDISQAHALHTGFLQSLVSRNADDAPFTAAHQHSYAALAVAAGMVGQGVGVEPEVWAQALPPEEPATLTDWGLAERPVGPLLALDRVPFPEESRHRVMPGRAVLERGRRSAAIWQPAGQAPRALGRWQDAVPGSLCFTDAFGLNTLHLSRLQRPQWASARGFDAYGMFVELSLSGATHRFRYLLPATFLMGSPEGVGHDDEHPQHPVTLTQGLWLAETPCTQALWQSVMGTNPSDFSEGSDAPRRPVENVSWNDVQRFLAKLNALLPEGCEAVLPTEAQWEYACRAGTQTAYLWGDEPDDSKVNWARQHKGTTVVDRYLPNPWGLRDMHGNVWEWCADDLRNYEQGAARDPMGDTGGDARVVRGGSWLGHPGRARSASRFRWHREGRYHDQGFRFALRSSSPQGAEPQPGGLKAGDRSQKGGAAGGRSAGAGASAPATRPTTKKKGLA
jgi:hypothetical protein